MILTIPGGASQKWGSAVLLNVSGIVYPGDAVDPLLFHMVLFKVSRGVGYAEIIFNSARQDSGSGTISLDISPYVTSPGNLKIEWGQKYRDALGWVTQWFTTDVRLVEIVDETVVVSGQMTITGGAVQLSGNPVQIVLTTEAAAMVGKTSFKRALKITCAALMGSPMIEEIAPDANLAAIFDISGLVDQPAVYDFAFPAVGVVADHRALELNVALDVGEIYIDADGTRHVDWLALPPATNSIRILKGFLRPYELAKLEEIGRNFNSEYIVAGKFLTHLPNEMKVAPGQIVKLWLLSKFPAIHAASWWCQVYYNPYGYYLDYQTPVGVYSQYLTDECTLDPISGLLEFNIEPAFMGFWNFHSPGAKILAYKFWLEDVAGEITEKRTFVIDDKYYEQSFFFYYVNPLSGIDSIWLHGEHSEHLKTERETAYRTVPVGSGTKVPGLKTVSGSRQRSWELNTGYKSKAEIAGLRDFLESRECWMVDPAFDTQNGYSGNGSTSRLIPVIIEAGEFTLFDSAPDYIPNLVIKILEANK